MFTELLKEARSHLWAQKLKNGLAALGIFWGAYAITLLVSLGQGVYAYNMKAVAPFTKTVLFITLRTTKDPFQGFGPGRALFLTNEEIMALPNKLTGIAAITPARMEWQNTFTTADKQTTAPLQGVSAGYYQFYTDTYRGRTLAEDDVLQHRQVAFLSRYAKQNLFPNQNPIGQSLSINHIYFKVVGYATSDSGFSLNPTGSDIPYNVFAGFYSNQVNVFVLGLKSGVDDQVFKKELIAYLASQLHFSPDDQNAVHIDNVTQYAKKFIVILLLAKYFLLFCGLMSLMVGGIGIANMMYLMVKERTPEIGLRMALGAEPNWILFGILFEALILVLLAGGLALVAAIFTISALQHMNLPAWLGEPHLIPLDFGLIFGFILLTALIAGYFPARHAAQILPVDALNDRGD